MSGESQWLLKSSYVADYMQTHVRMYNSRWLCWSGGSDGAALARVLHQIYPLPLLLVEPNAPKDEAELQNDHHNHHGNHNKINVTCKKTKKTWFNGFYLFPCKKKQLAFC